MFNKNSAFTPTPEVQEHLKRAHGLLKDVPEEPQQRIAQKREAAYDLLVAAKLMLEIDSNDAAAELVNEAIEALEE
jgi:hypothetical protein